MSLKSLLRLRTPSLETPPTAEQIAANRREYLLCWIGCALVGVTGLGWYAFFFTFSVIPVPTLFAFIGAGWLKETLDAPTDPAQIAGQACIDLLELVGKHPGVRRYVDAVVAQGRPLLKCDLHAARVLAKKEEEDELRAQQKAEEAEFRARAEAACRALHRMPTQGAND